MDRRILSPILLVLALFALVYAIYRSVGEKIVVNEAGRQTVYGEPQDGLSLGLCLFAGMCVMAAAMITPRRNSNILRREETTERRRIP